LRSATATSKFFIVKSGEIEIVDHSGDEPKTVTVHRKGQFTGEITHLTGNPAVVSAIARGDCEVYQISGDALRRVLNQCPAVSDIILQAFIARRQLLRESSDFTGLRVIGSATHRYLPRPRLHGQEPHVVHLGGHRHRPAGGPAA